MKNDINRLSTRVILSIKGHIPKSPLGYINALFGLQYQLSWGNGLTKE